MNWSNKHPDQISELIYKDHLQRLKEMLSQNNMCKVKFIRTEENGEAYEYEYITKISITGNSAIIDDKHYNLKEYLFYACADNSFIIKKKVDMEWKIIISKNVANL